MYDILHDAIRMSVVLRSACTCWVRSSATKLGKFPSLLFLDPCDTSKGYECPIDYGFVDLYELECFIEKEKESWGDTRKGK